jgi:ABC-2 type transport system ATP-binding protein
MQEFLNRFADIFNDEILGKRKYIRDLSKGNQKKVGIAAALMSNPEILILDEPFANLDPSTQIRLKNMLRVISVEKQVTMLISSHDLSHVIEVCERIVVLNKGEIVQDIQTSENTLKELEAYFAV